MCQPKRWWIGLLPLAALWLAMNFYGMERGESFTQVDFQASPAVQPLAEAAPPQVLAALPAPLRERAQAPAKKRKVTVIVTYASLSTWPAPYRSPA